MVGLLSVGSEKAPKKELIGEAGQTALVEAKKGGEEGLAAYFKKEKVDVLAAFGKDGLPPLPSNQSLKADGAKYNLTPEPSYPET